MGVSFVFLALYFLIWLIKKLDDINLEAHNRRIQEFDDPDLYRSAAGTLRDKKTREYRAISHVDGDLVTTDGSGHIYRNVSQEQREREYLQKKYNHTPEETTYVIRPQRFDYHHEISGSQYKDYQTDRIYVIRSLVDKVSRRKIRYYLDIETLELVRPIETFQEKLEDIIYKRLDQEFRNKWDDFKLNNIHYVKMCEEIKL